MGILKRTIKNSKGKKIKYWQIRIQNNKRTYYKTVGRVGEVQKSTVQTIHDDMKAKISLGKYYEFELERKTPVFKDFAKEYLEFVRDVLQKRSWIRDRTSINSLNKVFGNFVLTEISTHDLTSYQSKRIKDGVKPATVNRELSCLRHIFNIAEKQKKFFGKNPVSEIKFLHEDNKTERILTFEEEKRLLESSPNHLQLVIITAINTGMRKSEILHLRWKNVSISNKIITLESTNTKNKKIRKVPLNSRMINLLNKQYKYTGDYEFVFLNSRGLPFKNFNSIKTVFWNSCKRASIKGLRFHDLRHTSATRMIENGASIMAVSQILGHSSLAITMRYAHPDKSLFQAVDVLE